MARKNVAVYNTDDVQQDCCDARDAKEALVAKEALDYGFYSKVLNTPFDSLSELKRAEEAYYAEQKAKADKAAQKKADAQKVEEAFKALNTARKVYKEDLIQLTKEYSDELDALKKAFELGKSDIQHKLATAEDNYAAALKEFTYDQYHLTLKDGDFEITISGSNKTNGSTETTKAVHDLFDIFNWGFGF